MINKKDITLVIADDHPMLRKGLYNELSEHDFDVVGQADQGMKALELIITLQPTVAILDIDMPLLSGFEVIKMAKDKGIQTRFILLSLHKNIDFVLQAKALKIDGYLLKEDEFFEIEKGILTVAQGQSYYSKSFEKEALSTASDELKKMQTLTPSERTILKLIAQETSTTNIAKELFVSDRTVEKHRSNIIAKLGLKTETNSLIKWAVANRTTILEL